MFALHLLQVIDDTNRDNVKVFAWYPVGVAAGFRGFGPPSVGGYDDPRGLIERTAKETGRDFDEVAFEVLLV